MVPYYNYCEPENLDGGLGIATGQLLFKYTTKFYNTSLIKVCMKNHKR